MLNADSALNLKLINVFDAFNVFITAAVKVQVDTWSVRLREIALADIQAFVFVYLLHVHGPDG